MTFWKKLSTLFQAEKTAVLSYTRNYPHYPPFFSSKISDFSGRKRIKVLVKCDKTAPKEDFSAKLLDK